MPVKRLLLSGLLLCGSPGLPAEPQVTTSEEAPDAALLEFIGSFATEDQHWLEFEMLQVKIAEYEQAAKEKQADE